MTRDDMRAQQIADWLRTLNFPLARLEPASNDASFRRYFRAWRADGATRVVMDAPPEKESIAPFLKVARLLQRCGVHVPEIDALDQAHGFVLMEDLGSVHYLERLRAGDEPDGLYADALAALRQIQVQGVERRARAAALRPRAPCWREMALMPEWFCERQLQLELTAEDRALLSDELRAARPRGTRAAGGVRASRLSLAQSHAAGAAQSRHRRFSGCARAVRSAMTWYRC